MLQRSMRWLLLITVVGLVVPAVSAVGLAQVDDGETMIVLGADTTEYTFTPASGIGATPAVTPVATPAAAD